MNIHLIGIKGVGMTALAQYYKSQGHIVTGSDTEEVFFTDIILHQLGIHFTEKFDADNITSDINFIVKSAAYLEDNIEVKTAINKKIKILDYAEAIGEISKDYFSIAVAGTHGKTTQSAMLGVLAQDLGLDPLCIIGSAVEQFGNRNARIPVGGGNLLIAETCEYKRHFLNFHPDIILLPSLDYDHTDYFKTIDDYENAFIEFTEKLPKYGILIACMDEVNSSFFEKLAEKRKDLKLITYGFNKKNNIVVSKPTVKDSIQTAQIESLNLEISLSIPGSHNILNATGCLIAVDFIAEKFNQKIDLHLAKKSLLNFQSTKRRMEKIGMYKGAILFDDYAHHPVEIEATIDSLKSFYPDKKIRVIFQSHTFTRSKSLEKDFAKSFNKADEVILAPIYPSARESVTKYTSENFRDAIKEKNPKLKYFKEYEDITKYLQKTLTDQDIAITMGAGDIWRVLDEF